MAKTGPRPAFKKYVVRLVTQLKQQLNLQAWRVDVSFDGDQDDTADNVTTVTYINVCSDYLKAYIYFCPYAQELWEQGRTDVVAECVTHEMVHILIDELYQICKRNTSEAAFPYLNTIHEQTNQRITRIVMQSLPKTFFSV